MVEGSAEQQEVARAFNTMADRLTHVARGAARVRGQRVAPAAHAADGPAPAHRGGRHGERRPGRARRSWPRRRPRRCGSRGSSRICSRWPPPMRRPRPASRSTSPSRRASAEARWRGRAEQEGRHVAVRAGDAGDRRRQQRRPRDEPRQPDRERARARARRQHRDDHLGSRRRARPSSRSSTTGPGSRPRMPPLAFERFQRGAARPVGRGGTGLGLAIVGALAARWGGSASLRAREPRAALGPRSGCRRRRADDARLTVPLPSAPYSDVVDAHARNHYPGSQLRASWSRSRSVSPRMRSAAGRSRRAPMRCLRRAAWRLRRLRRRTTPLSTPPLWRGARAPW